MYKIRTIEAIRIGYSVRQHQYLHLSTNAENETRFIQYGQLLLLSTVMYIVFSLYNNDAIIHEIKKKVVRTV